MEDDYLSLSDGGTFSGFEEEEVRQAELKTKSSRSKKGKGPGPVKSSKKKKSSDVNKKSSDENANTVGNRSQSSDPPVFDITKLSTKDIDSLRTVLGIQANKENIDKNNRPRQSTSIDFGDNEDLENVSLGRPVSDFPNLRVELDSSDIENEHFMDGGNFQDDMSRALFESGDNFEDEWSMPRLKTPEKGKPVSSSLAKLINVACTSQCETESLIKKYKVPENCTMASAPVVNQEVWKTLDKSAHWNDKVLVDIQNLVSVGIAPIIRLTEIMKEQNAVNSEAKALISDALTIMGQVQYNLSLRRRYMIRPSLKRKYSGLCQMSMPITTKLFGDELSKEIKNCDSLASLGRDSGSFNYRGGFRPSRGRFMRRGSSYTSQYGGFQGHRYQPYQQRGQYGRPPVRGRAARKPATTSVAPNEQM